MSSKKILKAVSIISIGTIISRIFGLFREITSANFFGTTFIYDAFLIAFMIPNFFRGIVAEGALNSAFIPVFTEYTTDEKKKKEANKVINLCFTSSIIITFSLLFIIYILSSFIPHFLSLQSKWFWVWTLLKFTFPYLIFISLTSLNMGILNVHKKFLLPSFSPVILDIFWIGSLFLLLPLFGNSLNERIFGLCFGIIGGGLFQFLYLLPIIKKMGYSYKLDFNFSHPAIRKMGRLILPVVAGVAVVPINLLVDYSLAGTLFNGAVSGLWYATRIFQLPLGVFAISISTASLPYFSENVVTKNFEQFKENFYFAMKLLFFILVPFTFGIILFKTEIITFLFKRGLFTDKSVNIVSFPLMFYSIGLAGYGGISVLTRAFYAFGDTSTPVKIGIFSILVNFVLDVILMKFLSHGGIALSTSAVGFTNFFLLYILFIKKHISLNNKKVISYFSKSLISSLIMAFFIMFFRTSFYYLSLPIFLITGIISAVIIYFLIWKITEKVKIW